MKEYKNFDLSKKTTFHIGGKAKKFFIPESSDELLKLIKKLNQKKYYIISGGSNLLINDKKEFDNVISMENVDNSISKIADGVFYVGCSNRIQNVINKINEYGYGGFEELYSLPAMFGGIIYMNAGIGIKMNPLFTISEFINKVKVINIENKKIEWLIKKDCKFSHRESIFHNNQYIILGAEIIVKEQNIKISKERIKNRLNICRKDQEWANGCFGTCFSYSNRKLLKIVSLLNFRKKGIYQSKKNCNWLVNDGNGTYDEAIKIINRAEKIHRFFHKKIKCEVIVWR